MYVHVVTHNNSAPCRAMHPIHIGLRPIHLMYKQACTSTPCRANGRRGALSRKYTENAKKVSFFHFKHVGRQNVVFSFLHTTFYVNSPDFHRRTRRSNFVKTVYFMINLYNFPTHAILYTTTTEVTPQMRACAIYINKEKHKIKICNHYISSPQIGQRR